MAIATSGHINHNFISGESVLMGERVVTGGYGYTGRVECVGMRKRGRRVDGCIGEEGRF